eukprot:381575-Prymnesium_polylepis.1
MSKRRTGRWIAHVLDVHAAPSGSLQYPLISCHVRCDEVSERRVLGITISHHNWMLARGRTL